MESVDAEEHGQPPRPYEQQEKNVHEKARQQRAPDKAVRNMNHVRDGRIWDSRSHMGT